MDHVEQFHNLGGNTIGEHRKNFNKYLDNLSNLNETEIATILENIKPKNHQEQIFLIELLSKYCHYDALINILLTSNKYLNKKLTRNLELIKYLINKYPPQEFIDKLCPKISYVTRNNIINKLSLVLTETNLAEEYFKAIFERYGLKQASAVLVSCDEAYIKHNITEHNLKLAEKQLIKLHAKYPNFAEYYFDEATPFNFNKCQKFGRYLAINDVATFFKLSEQGAPKIGRTGIYNFMKTYKKEIIENPEKYLDILIPRVANKIFNSLEYQDFFVKLLPKSIDDFSFDELTNYLKAIPAKIRGTILFESYEKNYNCKYNKDELSTNLLDLLIQEDRLKFELEEKFPEYLPTEKSINLIKEKIKFTSDLTLRSGLVNKLAKTCSVNKDQDALLEVLKYVIKRHKNEVPQIRQNFIYEISNQFKLETLSQEHWKYLEGLLKIAEINGESHWSTMGCEEKLIEFKYNNGIDYTENLKKFVENPSRFYSWVLNSVKPEIERVCIIKSGELLNTLTFQDRPKSEIANSFFYTISTYNEKKSKNKISYLKYPEHIKSIFEMLSRDNISYTFYLPKLLMSNPENKQEEELLQLIYKQYFEIKPTYKSETIVLWLLKKQPELIATYAEACFDTEGFKLNPDFYYEASKMHYNNVATKLKETALSIVNNDLSKASQIEPALIFLSFTDEYFNLLDKYQPTNYSIDIYEDNIKEILAIKKSLLKSLCYIPISTEGISTIISYCKGDYLQHAIRALYKALYNMPEELIEDSITILLDNKQTTENGIYLVSSLSTSQHIRKILTKMGATQKSKGIAKFIFKRTFKLLINFPDDDFWNLLIKHFQLLDPNDIESFELLTEITSIPKKFRPKYVRIVWDHAFKLKKHYQVLTMIQLDIWKQLPKEFCEEVLNAILFNDKNEQKEITENLVYEYLLNDGNLSTIYKKEVETKTMYELLVNICLKLMQDNKRKQQALKLSKKLTNSISEVPLIYHKYRLKTLFESTEHFLQIENNYLDSILDFLLKKQIESIIRYGIDIATIFRDFASEFLKNVISSMETSKLKNRENRITDLLLEAAEKIAKTSNGSHVKLLALHLIPRKQSKNKEFNKKRKEVVDVILANCDEVVEVYVADAYFKEDI